ncbi:efflux RND transporter periplasmic adaptor subunit [Orbus sasakiae]|uniref:Efflux RND transporter periplasmic adaptor subunit n=1 Tax=Orbus sasakiae TaxID=1078475 RepID=A0ABP9ND50_9GAMM
MKIAFKYLKSWSWIVLPFITAAVLTGCNQDASDLYTETEQTPHVQTVVVKPQPLIMTSTLPGRVEPFRVAEVRARVEGIILSRDFEEGAEVQAGQALFHIDPKPLQYALSRAQGELARAEATLVEAQALINRYQTLVKTNAVSKQAYDSAFASFKNAQAARQSALADVEIAKLNLDYSVVTAPISGRIGRAQVSEGALVGQNESTKLAVIQQISPIYVDFKQPVADVLKLRNQLTQGHIEKEQKIPLTVSIDGIDEKQQGHVLFSDITVEQTTGQVLLRGQLDNADGLLLPGMYVRVNLEQAVDQNAILVPQRAVQINSDGQADVLIVDRNHVIDKKTVVTGGMYGANWHIVSGLSVGDTVIIGGYAPIGSQIDIKNITSTNEPLDINQHDYVATH